MTKLEVGKECWVKAYKTGSFEIDSLGNRKEEFQSNTGDTFDVYLNSEYVKSECATAIPEREKVTIPKFVAEWIVSRKEYEYDLNDALCNGISDGPAELEEWLLFPENQDTFARAWLDGYGIEKEPLYTVVLPDPNRKGNNCIYLGKADNTGKAFINKGTFNPKKNKNLWLTESEIKKDFEWAWKFAVPVEENDE